MGRAFRSLATAVLLTAAAHGFAVAGEPSVPDAILAKAVDSYRAGNLEPAIGGINAAMRGGLSSEQTARAFYYRGLAYRKQGSPGRAISDLTRALDSNALTDAERSDAMEARTTAYQEAGIANQETVVVSPTTGSESKAPVRSQQATATLNAPEGAKPKPAWTSPQVVINAPLAPPAPQVQKPSAPQARAPSPSPAATVAKPAPTRPAAQTSVAAAKPATAATAKVPVAAMAAEKAPPKVTGVSAGPATWADAKITTSALAPVAAPLPVPVRKAEPAAPPRLQVASVAPFLTQVSAEPAPDPIWLPASINAVALPPAASEVRLLVGAAHSRSEAFALLVRLTSQRGAALGPRRPQIADATPPGSDPLYRLRLGPFEAGHAQTLCHSLNDSGYPCAVE